MAVYRYANNPATTLSGAVTSGATSISVSSATDFPAQGKFTIIVDSEIMVVTGVSGTTWTVTRGAEGTSAAAHTNNSAVTHVLTVASFLNAHHVDVRAFGATGDGTTDDLDAFEDARDAIYPDGGTIFVPDGDYYISDTWVLDLDVVHLELSPGATIFSDQSTASGQIIGFSGHRLTAGQNLTALTPQRTWASIRGGTIRDDYATASTNNAIGFARFKNARVENVRIADATNKAITAQYGVDNIRFIGNTVDNTDDDSITVETGANHVEIAGNRIVLGAARGIVVLGSNDEGDDERITDLTIRDNSIVETQDAGAIYVTRADRVVVQGNHIATAADTGISVLNSSYVHIDGNTIESVSGKGIVCITDKSVEIRGNIIDDISTTNSDDAIYLESLTNRPVVMGNHVNASGHRYNLNCVSMSTVPAISVGNHFTTASTATYGGTAPVMIQDLVAGVVVGRATIRAERGTSAQSISTATTTTVIYNTSIREDDEETSLSLNTTTGVITVARAGWYRLSAGILWGASSTGVRIIRILVGSAVKAESAMEAASSTAYGQSVSTEIYLSASDTVSAQVRQTSGSALDATNDSRTFLSVSRIK